MSRVLALQELVTIGGPSGANSIVQDASEYLDLSAFQDVTLWVNTVYSSSSSSSLVLAFETAPIKDDTVFKSMLNLGGDTLSATSIVKSTVQLATASTPLSRWLRWHLTTPGAFPVAWQLTFRIWASVPQGW